MESIIYENLHEKTLQDISYEVIRQNWTSYQDIMCNSPYYDLLWENWEKKHNIDKTDIYFMLFKQFIHNEDCNRTKPWFDRIYVEQVNPETLILKGLNGSERKHIHILCDQIGFHHKSISQQKKYVRFLYIYKPNIWLWEYTEPNPHSKSREYYVQRQLQIDEKLRKIYYCCICGTNGLKTELLCSPYISGTYCNDCLEITSDDDGGKLCDHKFEYL
jgi:hypothetical protein